MLLQLSLMSPVVRHSCAPASLPQSHGWFSPHSQSA